MEIFAVIAVIIITWMAWQLYRAKQFTHFKQQIQSEIKPKVIAAIRAQLEETRSELTPNNDCHVQATINYWCQHPARIMQYALNHEIVTKDSLIEAGNYRHCQHLFHIEKYIMH
ncbi:hypothetical protein tinsulaeT_28470 [Thalassotalea insulae]|uniref:DUF2489 domain-containing protein n=1 Tax=Thalassotalea insulae TaxID=2056778 RepID=A0ABQ6GVV7_9GAMM|nr:hypothetical protein [Thalassotalea insulae]GLX79507.1 hypothetical protein tinsulaeT_28470 [Thalassotalea insulae]